MPLRRLTLIFLCLLLLGAGMLSRGGMTSYTDKGKVDFDVFLQLLNPYGTWSRIDNKWAYTPLDHIAPYTKGRWIYTEFGWNWKGSTPHSWATEHYGYWKRGANKVWSWYPGPFWLPQIVETRATTRDIGWRSAPVDDDGNFTELPVERYSKPEEWTFVTLAQFANPITPGIIASPKDAEELLDVSTDCRHTYLTYREIDRPGPHPADFADLDKDGGMLAPQSMEDREVAQKAVKPAIDPHAAKMTGTAQPALIGSDVDPSADTRKVKYWVTMSLPNYWAKPPDDAKSDEVYIYRPDTFQDQDGIERRITLWFNPKQRTTLKELMSADRSPVSVVPGGNSAPAADAETPPPSHSAFSSPLDESYHPGPGGAKPTTNAPGKNAVPSGTNVPSGIAPNAAPINPQ